MIFIFRYIIMKYSKSFGGKYLDWRVLLLIVLIGVVVSMLWKNKESFTSSSPDDVHDVISKGNALVWFYFPGCTHCVAMDKEWDKLVDMKHDYKTVAIDGSKDDPVTTELKKSNNITSYPSIIFFTKDGVKKEFTDTERTAVKMDEFASVLTKGH